MAIAEHVIMIDAIAAGDAAKLGATIQVHIDRPKEFCTKTSFVQPAL